MRPEVLVVLVLGACAEIDQCVPGPGGSDQCRGEEDAASLIQLRQSNVTERVEAAGVPRSEPAAGERDQPREREPRGGGGREEDEPAAAAMAQQQEDEKASCPWTPIKDVAAAPSWKALADARMLRNHHDQRCLERQRPGSMNNGKSEVFVRDCDKEKAEQFWILKDNGELKTAWAEDVKDNGEYCADYHQGNNDVYMHSCHGGNNQKWYFGGPEGNELMSKQDHHCLDYHLDQHNAYMHSCHGGNNQKWSFAAPITKTYTDKNGQKKEKKNGQVNWVRRRRRRTDISHGYVDTNPRRRRCTLLPYRP